MKNLLVNINKKYKKILRYRRHRIFKQRMFRRQLLRRRKKFALDRLWSQIWQIRFFKRRFNYLSLLAKLTKKNLSNFSVAYVWKNRFKRRYVKRLRLPSIRLRKKIINNKKRFWLRARTAFRFRLWRKRFRRTIRLLFSKSYIKFKRIYKYKNPRRYWRKFNSKKRLTLLMLRKEYSQFFTKIGVINTVCSVVYLDFFKHLFNYKLEKKKNLHFSFYTVYLQFFTQYLMHISENTKIFINHNRLVCKKKNLYVSLLSQYLFLLRKLFSAIYFFKTLKTTPELSAVKWITKYISLTGYSEPLEFTYSKEKDLKFKFDFIEIHEKKSIQTKKGIFKLKLIFKRLFLWLYGIKDVHYYLGQRVKKYYMTEINSQLLSVIRGNKKFFNFFLLNI